MKSTVASVLLLAALTGCGGGAAPSEPQESPLSRLLARQRCAELGASAPAAASQAQSAKTLPKDAKNCPGR